MREFAPALELARGSALRPWLVGLGADSPSGQIEAVLRGHGQAMVDEVAALDAHRLAARADLVRALAGICRCCSTWRAVDELPPPRTTTAGPRWPMTVPALRARRWPLGYAGAGLGRARPLR